MRRRSLRDLQRGHFEPDRSLGGYSKAGCRIQPASIWAGSDCSAPFSRHVYACVRRVPRGKVVTYGQVAALLGRPQAARAVGLALKCLPEHLLDVVPWHRVINALGRVSYREFFWCHLQRALLEDEGVRFDSTGTIDLRRFHWLRRPRRRRA